MRAAVIGTGGWGHTHIEAYWRNPHTELVAICGHTNRARVEEVSRQYNTRAYLDIEAMLEKEKPDIVSVITPDAHHFKAYKSVIDAGVDCVLEKPLTMDADEARTLVQSAKAKGIRCGINFNHRYSEPFSLLADAVQQGQIGHVNQLIWRFTGGHYPEGHPLPLAHLLYMQSHGFNMMQTFGGPIVSIAGHAHDPRNTGQFTTASFSFQFESGAVGTFIASVDEDYHHPNNYSFEVTGSSGRAVVYDAIRRYEYFARPTAAEPRPLAHVWDSPFFDDESRQFAKTTDRHIQAFVEAKLNGSPVPIPIEEGLYALYAGLAATEAAMTHTVVQLDFSHI